MLRYDRCQNVAPGARWIALSDLATIRGAQLLPGSAGAGTDGDPVFVMFNGRVPSPGYDFVLQSGEWHDQTLTLRFDWQTALDPDVDAAPRTPCVAYALPDTLDVSNVRILLDDALFAELTVPDRATASP